MNKNLKFEEIETDSDIKKLEALACFIWNEYWRIILSQEQINYMLNLFQSYDAIKNQLENEGCIYKILKFENEETGYFAVCKRAEPNEHLYLSKLYLKKAYRGKGLGSMMFNEVKKIANELGLRTIRLNVNKQNINSIRAYEHWGFQRIESIVVDIGRGFVMDDYTMEYSL